MTKKLPWGLILLEAVGLIVIGVLSAIYATQALKLLVILIGMWSAIIGAFMLFVMVRTKNLWNKGFYIVSAVLSILFGVLLIAVPMAYQIDTIPWFIVLSGIIALVFGIIMMMFGFAIHRAEKDVKVEVVETSTPEAPEVVEASEVVDAEEVNP
jgi:uncharacterized membrane protein HdeD (DUF308 family)